MKKYLKGMLAIVLAILVFIPATVFAEEVSNIFINKENKISFTGAEGYSVYQVYVKYGNTEVDAFGHNSGGTSTYELANRIKSGCDRLTDVCPENYVGNYTLEIVALDTANSYAVVESTRTTKTISLKHVEFDGDDYYHVDVVGNETKYTVTLEPNDGIQVAQKMNNLVFGQHVQLGTFESYGYVKQPKNYYYGWDHDDFYVAKDTTIYMNFEPLFTMTIDFNGGTLNGQGTFTKESVAYAPTFIIGNIMHAFGEANEVVPPTGKEIDYVTVDGVAHQISETDGFMLNKDVEIKYFWKWSEGTTRHTVTFTDGFDNVLNTVEVADGEKVQEPEEPTMGGLVFSSWKLNGATYDFNTPVTSDITLDVFWNFNFLVKANVNGAAVFKYNGIGYPNEVGSAGYYHEEEIIGVDQEEIGEYALKEWRLDSLDGPVIGDDPSADYYISNGGHLKIRENIYSSGHTFYAIYEKTKVAVTFNTNGGTAINTQYVKPGERAKRPNDYSSTKEGYVLGDWYADPELTQKFDFGTPIEAQTTLYASWKTRISEVRGTVNKPVAGFTADTNIVSNDNRYSFELDYWYLTTNGYPRVEGDSTFELDSEYEIRYHVIPAEGYDFDYKTKFYLNGEETECYGSAGSRQIRWVATAPQEVSEFNVSGIVAPVAGNTPKTNIVLNDGLKVLGTFWTEESSSNELTANDKFVNGKRYILHIRYNTTYGYVLAGGFNEDAIVGAPAYLMAENINNIDEYEMQIRYEAKAPTKITKAPKLNAKNHTDNTILLTWNKVAGAEKYMVYRSTDKKKWTKINTVTEISYIDTGLTYGKKYYYKVKAANDISNKVSDIITGKTVPNKVVNLKINGGSTNNVKLTWDRVKVTGYEVYSSINNKKWYKIATITKNDTLTYNNKSLKANTKYYYKVRAYKTVSGKKVYGSYSAVLTIKTAPVKPGVTLKLKNLEAMKITIKESKGASSYVIQKSLDGKTYTDYSTITKAETLTDNGHEIGKKYYYRVKACGKSLCSGWVAVDLKQTTKAPSYTLKTSSKKVAVTLNAVEGADGYQVYRATSKKGKYTIVKDITSLDSLTITDKTTKGRTYYYKVRSYKIVDEKPVYSPYSGIKNIRSK